MSFGKIGSLEKKEHDTSPSVWRCPSAKQGHHGKEGLALSPSFLTAASSKGPEGLKLALHSKSIVPFTQNW